MLEIHHSGQEALIYAYLNSTESIGVTLTLKGVGVYLCVVCVLVCVCECVRVKMCVCVKVCVCVRAHTCV